MDRFKSIIIDDYGYEKDISREYGKNKIQHRDKKSFRKLARTRLKNELRRNKDIV